MSDNHKFPNHSDYKRWNEVWGGWGYSGKFLIQSVDGTEHVQLILSNLKTPMTYSLCAWPLNILHHMQISRKLRTQSQEIF